MTGKKTAVWVLAGLLGVGVAASWAAADPAGGDGASAPTKFWGGKLGKLIRARIARLVELKTELNVTAEQRERLQAIRREHRAELAPVLKKVVAKKRVLREAVMAEPPDEQAIRAAADDLGNAIGEVAVAASKVVGEVRQVLTPEQVQTLLQFRREGEDRFLQWLDREPQE